MVIIYCSHLLWMTVGEKLAHTGGKYIIGLKLRGRDGSVCAVDLAISLTAAIFQVEGSVKHIQYKLKLSHT